MRKKIAILAGDGIGPEVMAQTLRVLDVIAQRFKHHFEYLHGAVGGAAYEQYASHCPDETLSLCQQADAILFGSVGGPVDQQHVPKWADCEANSILKLRKHFNFNINLRPVRIYSDLTRLSPLRADRVKGGIELLIFRELNGDIYFGKHRQTTQNDEPYALDEAIYSASQVSAIAHAAFRAAAARKKQLVSIDKANVLATSRLWRDVVNQIAVQYPQVHVTHLLVDNAAMQLVLNPQQFDVMLAPNLFGDILSDLAAALTGSLGLVPSASLNAHGFGLYEPSGGSAPDIAGRNIANPIAQIVSAAMLLRYSLGLWKEADMIENAVKIVLANGAVTADIAQDGDNCLKTDQFADKIIAALESCASF